jgi:hypothetical protein
MRKETSDPVSDTRLNAMLLALSAAALGYALQINHGMQHPDAMRWLLVSLTLCVIAVASPWPRTRDWLGRYGQPMLLTVLAAGLVIQLVSVATSPPAFFFPADHLPLPLWVRLVLGMVGVLAVAGLVGLRPATSIWFPVAVAVHVVVGLWVIGSSPAPVIDVYVFQRDASAALLAGENPYTVRYPDIYGTDRGFYGPGLSQDGWLTFGFPYFPLSLLLVVPGHLLAGDFRYAHLAATTLAGLLMAGARPGSVALGAAALYLFTPRVFFILEQGWTEPLLVLLLAASLYCAVRSPPVAPFVFGLFVAVKQYLVFAAAMGWLLGRASERSEWRFLAIGAAAATAVTLPFALWDLGPFVYSVVTLQFHQPFRPDSLSILAWIATRGGPLLPGWTAFAAALPALTLAFWRGSRTPAGYAASVALVYFVFFAFNKQAFGNYYLFVVGALCCAVAATPTGRIGGQ